jgi:hypothetical protein
MSANSKAEGGSGVLVRSDYCLYKSLILLYMYSMHTMQMPAPCLLCVYPFAALRPSFIDVRVVHNKDKRAVIGPSFLFYDAIGV